MNISKPIPVATNAFDITIDGIEYRIANHGVKYSVWTKINGQWNFDASIPDTILNEIAREISAYQF